MQTQDFVAQNAPDEEAATFEREHSKLLDAEVDEPVWAKAGAMVANEGELTFTGKTSAEGGVTGWVKEKMTSEGMPVMKVEGTGHVYLADQAKEIQVLDLAEDEELTVNGNDILAFEDSVDFSIGAIDSLSGISAGGMTNVYLTGPGYAAITTHGHPIVLEPPVKTDPSATVAWSGVSPSTHVDRNLKNMVGQSSGEGHQLEFAGGDGFVVVQPYEEVVDPGQA